MTRAGLDAVADRLAAEPYRFDFFQAVRLLRRMTAGQPGEPIRFRTDASLDFPASELKAHRIDADDVHELVVTFLGLTGPSGVLPRHYTELLVERRFKHRDDALHEFLDLFTHRLVALFYAAWEKHRFYVPFERGEPTPLTQMSLDLAGLGLPGLQRRLFDGNGGLRDAAIVYYGGLASQRPHSAASLAAVVGDLFDVSARMEPFVGRWVTLPQEDRASLGRANCGLGTTLVVGERVWECQSKCELRLGPLTASAFASLLPDGDAHPALVRLVRWFLGPGLDCRIRLVLDRHAFRPAPLGTTGGGEAPRLGYTSRAACAPLDRDPDEVVFECP